MNHFFGTHHTTAGEPDPTRPLALCLSVSSTSDHSRLFLRTSSGSQHGWFEDTWQGSLFTLRGTLLAQLSDSLLVGETRKYLEHARYTMNLQVIAFQS